MTSPSPNWSDPAYAKTTGLTPDQLKQIIAACETASKEMGKLGGETEVAAGTVRAGMDSKAGRILDGRLQEWRTEFQGIIRDFDELNNRSTQLLAALQQADADSTARAGGNRS